MEDLSELEAAVEELWDCLVFFEDDPLGEEALNVADRIAELEYGTEVLRRLGERLDGADYFNEEIVVGSAGARCTDALYFLLKESIGVAEESLALDEYRYQEAIEDKLYPYIDGVVEEIVDDALASHEAVWPRQQALAVFERAGRCADEKGKVLGFDEKTLRQPRARDWCTEYANDTRGLIDHYTVLVLEDDSAPLAHIPGFDLNTFRPGDLRKAIAGLLVGQSWAAVANKQASWDGAYWNFARYVEGIREAQAGDRAVRVAAVNRGQELAAAVLGEARKLAAHCTAYAVLDRCLIGERVE